MHRFTVVLNRVDHLLVGYPALSWASALLPLFGTPVCASPAPSRLPLTTVLALPTLALCWATLLACMHYYDLARQRVQEVANKLDTPARIRADFSFASFELRRSYERWLLQGPFWKRIDYGAAITNVCITFKLSGLPECGMGDQLRMVVIPCLLALRALCRRSLSPTALSAISLFEFQYAWLLHLEKLINGNQCAATIGRKLYRGSLATGVLMSCLGYSFNCAIAPVSQEYFVLKLLSGVVGFSLTSYIQILQSLSPDHEIDWALDVGKWKLYWLLFGMLMTALALFRFGTVLNENGMQRYLSAQMLAPR